MRAGTRKAIAAWAGVAFFVATLLVDSPFPGMSSEAWRTLGLAVWMAVWWITEYAPIPATSLLPLVIGPIFGLTDLKQLSASYAHPLIFLFFGGFVLSLAIEKVGLHERIARAAVSTAGSNSRSQLAAVMGVTAFLSMWISNTATAVIMLPIALSMSKAVSGSRGFQVALLLGVAYGASIGGLATLVGTPPNAFLAAYLESNYNLVIGFGQWMLFGVPLSLLLLFFAWLVLSRLMGAVNTQPADSLKQIEKTPLSRREKGVAVVFALTVLAWVFRGVIVSNLGIWLTDTGIAVTAAFVLFLIPSGSEKGKAILVWKDTEHLPWGVLLLFGGGLALATLMKGSGLDDYVGSLFSSLEGAKLAVVLAVVVGSIVFLTEVTSNTATAATLIPLVGPVALAMGVGPEILTIPAAIAASCAFMLPVATPPNAIVFSSGEVRVAEMARIGLIFNLISTALLVALGLWLVPIVFG